MTDPEIAPGWRSLLVDPTPLRLNREFRRLYVARVVSFIGSMITFVALPAQVFSITRSSLQVGLIGIVEVVPLVGAALFGGALADRIDRRRLIVVCEFAMVACTALLAANARQGSQAPVWPLYVFAACAAGFDGLQRPAIEALSQQVLDRKHIVAANGLNSALFSFGMVVGPILGGVVLDVWGFEWAYGLDAASFAVGGLLALSLGARRAERDPDSVPDSPWSDVAAGLRYARRRKDLLGSYLVDVNAMVFGMPLALFPAMALDLGGRGTLGLLYAGPGIGSLTASLFASGLPRRTHRHGVGLLWSACGWGIAIVAFGFAKSVPLAVGMLAIAGAADMVSGMFRMAMWNESIPNEVRGRLAGIEMISYSASPPLGNVESGLVAAATSARTSVISGGVLCVACGAVIAILLPTLRAYDAHAHRDASAGA